MEYRGDAYIIYDANICFSGEFFHAYNFSDLGPYPDVGNISGAFFVFIYTIFANFAPIFCKIWHVTTGPNFPPRKLKYITGEGAGRPHS